MDGSTSGFPVHHQLLEFTQTYVHWAGEAIQASHPLPSPSPPTLNLFQHQGLFQWVGSFSNQVAKVLELQHQSFQWIFRVDFLEGQLVWCPCSPRVFQESSLEPQFGSINSSDSSKQLSLHEQILHAMHCVNYFKHMISLNSHNTITTLFYRWAYGLCAAVHGVAKSWTQLSDWTELIDEKIEIYRGAE